MHMAWRVTGVYGLAGHSCVWRGGLPAWVISVYGLAGYKGLAGPQCIRPGGSQVFKVLRVTSAYGPTVSGAHVLAGHLLTEGPTLPRSQHYLGTNTT